MRAARDAILRRRMYPEACSQDRWRGRSVTLSVLDGCVLVVWRVRARCTGFLLERGAPEGAVCADTPSPLMRPVPCEERGTGLPAVRSISPRSDVLQTKRQTIVYRVARAPGISAPAHEALAILIV